MVRTLFQTFVQQNETVLFPVQSLDSIPPSPAKQKQRIGKRIQLKLLLDEPRQAVYAQAM